MSKEISESFSVESFRFDIEQIERWKNNKIPLPKSTMYKYIAPDNLVATLLDDVSERYGPFYGAKRVGKEISHFPADCELITAINLELKKYNCCIPDHWISIVDGVRKYLAEAGNKELTERDIALFLEKKLHLRGTGLINNTASGDLVIGDGEVGVYYTTSFPIDMHCECLTLECECATLGFPLVGPVKEDMWMNLNMGAYCSYAYSIRCVML